MIIKCNIGCRIRGKYNEENNAKSMEDHDIAGRIIFGMVQIEKHA